MAHAPQANGSASTLLVLGALGIVYGDIGTSPLYAMRESFEGAGHELVVTPANVLGVLSLVVWSLVVVISIRYLVFVMRADNEGEGGILVLTSLIPVHREPSGRRRTLVLLGLFGTALLYGDGMITPAISVLSAVEGTEVAAPRFAEYAVPIAVVILVVLFAVQHRGTATVGRAFGPVMVLWFAVLGLLGLIQIFHEPQVLRAVNPVHAVRFFADNGSTGFLVLGSVFLVVTGGEALYADMGHFGRRPIAVGWFSLVFPGLLLNYFGQGALLIAQPEAIDNPFYRLAPAWASIPLMVLATAATVIASQALISGAYSLTMQAAQFGYLPRVRIVQTSAQERGQIYVPSVNWLLMIACVGLVIGFGSSTQLAAAYGVAVTMTMVITTLVYYLVVRDRFRWSLPAAVGICGMFLFIDLAFFGANLPKVPHGGWFPLVVGALIFTVLTTWFTGRRIIRERTQRGRTPLSAFLATLDERAPQHVEGTAVYLFGIPGMAPPPLIYNLRSNHVLHERVFTLNVVTERMPRVDPTARMTQTQYDHGVCETQLHYGFMEEPDVARDLERHLGIDPQQTTYFLGKETVVVTDRPGMAKWRERLFAALRRNATSASDYFNLPPGRVFQISVQVEL
ncbi:MAG TPA: potassium transporter Kup [Nitriliruptorales bacterium]|nr:potassium transporter Kup [Nitriliruptorales bacterium]